MNWEQQLGERVSLIRRERNLTRSEFGELIGVSEQYVGRIERGKHTISGAVIYKICDKTGISADYIVFGKVDLAYTISDYTALSVEQAKVTLDIVMNVVNFIRTQNGNDTLLQEVLCQHQAASASTQGNYVILSNSNTFNKRSAIFARGGFNVDYLHILGEQIRFYRKANNITQIELAERLGVAPRYIGNIEQGNRKPSLDMLVEICIYFGVSLSDLLPIGVEYIEMSLKERMIYEIVSVCRTLDTAKVAFLKSMICSSMAPDKSI